MFYRYLDSTTRTHVVFNAEEVSTVWSEPLRVIITMKSGQKFYLGQGEFASLTVTTPENIMKSLITAELGMNFKSKSEVIGQGVKSSEDVLGDLKRRGQLPDYSFKGSEEKGYASGT